jgi:hypothetical protein
MFDGVGTLAHRRRRGSERTGSVAARSRWRVRLRNETQKNDIDRLSQIEHGRRGMPLPHLPSRRNA